MTHLSDRIVSHIDTILRHLLAMTESWKVYRRKVQISGGVAAEGQEQVASDHLDADAGMQKEIAAIGKITTDVKKETRS